MFIILSVGKLNAEIIEEKVGNVTNYRNTEDISMCKDTSARAQIGIYPMFSPKTISYIQSLDKTNFAKIKQEALDWDTNHPQRVNPIWSCHHGMGAFTGNVKIKNMNTFDENKQMIRDAFSKAF